MFLTEKKGVRYSDISIITTPAAANTKGEGDKWSTFYNILNTVVWQRCYVMVI